MQDTDPAVQHVNDYISNHGMVLVSRKTGPYDGMFGNTEQSHYATPQVRLRLTERTAKENNE